MKRFTIPKAAALSLAMVSALLSGCATTPGQRNAPPAAAEPVALTAESRGQFDEAMELLRGENAEKGIELLERVASVSRNHAVPHINLAMAYGKAGQNEKAEASLRQALAIEPANPVAINEYGLLLRRSGRFDEARKMYEEVLRQYPRFALAHRNLGVLCDLYLRDYACALRGYEGWSAAHPEDKTVRIWIADMQKRTGGAAQ
jgi:Tfp pilus assembly protein PilF